MKKQLVTASVALLTGLSLVLPQAQAQSVHTVQSGEYLYSIANAYGVTVEQLRAWNGLVSDMVFVGDQLIVNGSSAGTTTTTTSSTAGTYTVQPGDVLVNIAARYGVTVENLVAWNGLSSDWLNVGDVLVVYGDATASSSLPTTTTTSSSSTGYYTVQAGDTLSGIAAAFGVTESDLWAWNGLSSDWLMVGDVLAVGGYGSGAYISNTTTATTTTYATGTYTVQAGDTLQNIALAYGMTLDDLMAINGLTSTFIFVGDVLAVADTSATTTTTDTSTETTTTDATTDPLAITDAEKEAGVKAKHQVVEGDNLYRIANQYGVTVYNLKLWNEISEDNMIQVGDILMIKGSVYEPRQHTVVDGDTVDTLATTYGTTADFIRQWNKLTEDSLTTGSKVYVSDPEVTLHTVVVGETLEQIAEAYQVTVEDIRLWNELPDSVSLVNGTLVVSNPAGQEVKVTPETTETTSSSEATTTQTEQTTSGETIQVNTTTSAE